LHNTNRRAESIKNTYRARRGKRKSRSGAKNKRGAIPERGSIGQEQNRIGHQPLSPKNFSKRFPLTKEKPTLVTRSKNFVDIKSLVKKLGADFYFTTPYHSWERGLNAG
jgi:IS30 family transposase